MSTAVLSDLSKSLGFQVWSKSSCAFVANTPLMRYCFPYVGADLRYLALQPDTSLHCKKWIQASVSRDVPVYSPSFSWVLMSPTHGGMAQAE